jgi:hypothetical protein
MTEAEEIANIFRTLGSDATSMKVVWNACYRPFLMGGDLRRPIKAEVPALGPFDLGKGYTGYIILHPKSQKTYIAESETGAFVGNSLNDVRQDIEAASEEVMRGQIAEAKKQMGYAELMTAEQFWTLHRVRG